MNRQGHPIEQLRAAIPPVPTDANGVVAQVGVIHGTAFFPGGWGLWGTQDGHPVPPLPVGGIMIVGQDFDTEAGFEKSLGRGFEVKVESDGTYDATRSRTWRWLLQFLGSHGVAFSECFFTNAYMGLRSGPKSTGQFPGATHRTYPLQCQQFFLRQLAAQRPRLVISLGTNVPPFLAPLAPQLAPWMRVRSFADIDRARPVRSDVEFDGVPGRRSVVALTHPSYRRLNVRFRQYGNRSGEDAESQMLREALRDLPPRDE